MTLRRAISRAQDNTQLVQGLLRPGALELVVPLVVFWGRDVIPPAQPVRREGNVRIVAGKAADQWLPLLSAERLEPDQIASFAVKLRKRVQAQEEADVGEMLGSRLQWASGLGRGSIGLTLANAALLAATAISSDFGRILGSFVGLGGGLVIAFMLLSPMALGIAALGATHAARRLDPTLEWWRHGMSLALWCAFFGLIPLVSN